MKTNSRCLSACFLVALLCSFASSWAAAASTAFYDDFSSGEVDSNKWYAAKRNWDYSARAFSGGVVPNNLSITNGTLVCTAHGELYSGKVYGVSYNSTSFKEDGKCTGAAVVTRDYFASGSYEIRAKVAPVSGVCCAMWTEEYEEEEYYEGEQRKVRELLDTVEFQLPGRPAEANTGISYGYALCNNASGVKGNKYDTNKSYVQLASSQDDGEFHTYRFDWHTGNASGTITPRVDFYVDGDLVQSNTANVPTKAGRLWVGAWFPNESAGSPNFNTSAFVIDYVSITPYHEENDATANETEPLKGLVETSEIETVSEDPSGSSEDKSGVTMEPFFDDFSSGDVDTNKWFAAKKNWGGKIKDENGKDTTTDYNGGVVPENLYVVDGKLQCAAHGNRYLGDVLGVNKDGSPRADGKRVGGCVVTKNYYASGRYEVRAKVAPQLGVCSAIWTFEYEEVYDKESPDYVYKNNGKDYYVINHEIDIEMPGRPKSEHKNIDFNYALCNTWIGEEEDEYLASHTLLPKYQNDGQFHTYRFDWHTGGLDPVGGTNITPRVDFYFDGEHVMTNYDYIPSKAGRLWVGTWFPNGWAGDPDFDTSAMEVDWVRITPFGEPNDRSPKETYGSEGMNAAANELPPVRWEVGSPVASNVTAYLTKKGTLVFNGSGSIIDYASPEDAPWGSSLSNIVAIAYEKTIAIDPYEMGLNDIVKKVNGKTYIPYVDQTTEPFFDDFSEAFVSSNNWYAANKNWGGETYKWSGVEYNGGVVPANLFVKDGVLQCVAHGDLYEGDIRGICEPEGGRDPMPRNDGKRVGACVVTKNYYASGRYEVRAKIAPDLGVCSAMWTAENEKLKYEDKDFPDFLATNVTYTVKQSIEFQTPGRPGSKLEKIGFDHVLCNTWVGTRDKDPLEFTKGYVPLTATLADGQFHTYRFDWHTGNKAGTIQPRVEFYIDDTLIKTVTNTIPTKAGRFWVGAWFPKDEAGGTPEFDTSVFAIDYVRITPFDEENDLPGHDTDSMEGLSRLLNLDTSSVWDVGSPNAASVKAHLNANSEIVFVGAGAVKDFSKVSDAPWATYANLITGARVPEGVTLGKKSQVGLPAVAYVNGIPLSLYNGDVTEAEYGVFYDDFTCGYVDSNKWYAAHKNWGGDINIDDHGENYNGGVVKENLYVKDEILKCEAHGSFYEGDILGVKKGMEAEPRENGKRAGACIVTKDYFASGSYEIRAKVAPAKGVCCTMWTFEYEEVGRDDPQYKGSGEYYVINHEIDIEMPGRPSSAQVDIGYDYALCNTWVGEKGDEYMANHTKLPKRQDDGEFHTYRFDWHTGNEAGTIRRRVEFYFDGELVQINYSYIPFKAGRFWVGAWFPRGWAGTPDFDSSIFEVDWIKITPYFEECDRPQQETYGEGVGSGLVEPLNVAPDEFWEIGSPVANDVVARINDKGELIITGKGAVTNYQALVDAPWADIADQITSVRVFDYWDQASPVYLYSKDYEQYWGYRVVEGNLSLGKTSLIGLDNLKTLNGVPLTRFDQVLDVMPASDPAAFRILPGIGIDSERVDLSLEVQKSSDNVNWVPAEARYKIGDNGNSVKVEVVK